jgi:hypothetical protein
VDGSVIVMAERMLVFVLGSSQKSKELLETCVYDQLHTHLCTYPRFASSADITPTDDT